MSDEEKINKLNERYQRAMHAMQTGVLWRIQKESERAQAGEDPMTHHTSPKHLRVGINSAMIESGAIVKLLVEKKIITEVEWFETLTALAEQEVKLYETWLTERMGIPVRLG